MSKLMEKIATLLGEELAKQVEAKLGKVELAILNDGSVVPAEKHEVIKQQLKDTEDKYKEDTKQMTKDLDEAIKAGGDSAAMAETVEKLKAEIAESEKVHQAKLLDIKKSEDMTKGLTAAMADPKYQGLLMKEIDTSKMYYQGDILVGLKEALDATKETYPKMFGEVIIEGTGTNKGKANDGFVHPKKADLIKAYDAAELKADVPRMRQISEQIKQLPKE